MTHPEQAHTPTPWTFQGTVISGDGQRLAILPPDVGNSVRQANAAYIVQAANSFEDLLAAAQDVERRLRAIANDVGADCEELDMANDLATAIKKAGAV